MIIFASDSNQLVVVESFFLDIDTMASAFFYGILLHPKILKRVLNNDASHLQICPAILTVCPLPPSPILCPTSR